MYRSISRKYVWKQIALKFEIFSIALPELVKASDTGGAQIHLSDKSCRQQKERPTCFSTDQPLRPVMPLTQIQTAHRDRTSQNGRRPASPWRRPPCRSLRTHRCPQDASAGHCQALRHLHPPPPPPQPRAPACRPSFSYVPLPFSPERSASGIAAPAGRCQPARRLSVLRQPERPETPANLREKPPQSCAWGGFARCEVSVSVQRMEKARTPAARSPVFILRVGYGDSKKAGAGYPAPACFNSLVR